MTTKRYLVLFLLLMTSTIAFAAGGSSNPSDVIVHHLADAHSWQPLYFLPAIPLPEHVTKVTILLFLTVSFVILLFKGFSQKKLVPTGLTGFIESIIIFIKDDIVYPALGKRMGEQWMPFFITIFFFILISNFMGLVPAFGSATGNVSVTFALSSIILVLMFYLGVKELGLGGFLKNLMPSGAPLPIALLIFVIEFLGFFIKAAALTIRLFANMMAGHIVIISLLMLIFVLHPGAAAVSFPFALFVTVLEVLVSIIQAVVFTLLSAIFIGLASHHH